MTHLGIRISSLVDGRLAMDVLQRANAHLARCSRCRQELAAERLLKAELNDLAVPPASGDLMIRLLELAGPAGPMPPRPGHVPGTPRPQQVAMPARSLYGLTDARPDGRRTVVRSDTRPAGRPLPERTVLGRSLSGPTRARLTAAVFGALCLAGAGVGAATAAGNTPVPSVSRVRPQLNQLLPEHLATFRTPTLGMFATVTPRR